MFVTYYVASIWHTPGYRDDTTVNYDEVIIGTRLGAAIWNSLFRIRLQYNLYYINIRFC